MRELDLNTWHRKKSYEFFKDFDSPFFNICASVDITALEAMTQKRGTSFFLAGLYCGLQAANAVESFGYRLRESRVVAHSVIHAGSTVLNEDKSFGFCYFDYHADMDAFCRQGQQRLVQYQLNPGLEPQDDRDDLIHFSVLPWIAFTGIMHARRFDKSDSIPKIVYGKKHDVMGRRKLPVSVETHHALMDGYDVGLFFEKFQEILNACA